MRFLMKNNSINSVISCGVTSGSTTVTMSSTAGLSVGMWAFSAHLPVNTTIVSIDSATAITVSHAATGTATENVTFCIVLPTDGAEFVLAIFATSFGGGTVTLEGSPDGGVTWIGLTKLVDNSAATFTANTFVVLYQIAQGYLVRARLSGATSPSGMYVTWGN